MKKIAVLALALAALYSQAVAQAGKEPTSTTAGKLQITMTRDGAITAVTWKGVSLYSNPIPKVKDTPYLSLDLSAIRFTTGKAFPKELPTGTPVTITIAGAQNEDKFNITIATQRAKFDLVPIFMGETEPSNRRTYASTAAGPEHDLASSFTLDESGTTYQIKVTKLDTDPAKDKDIFTESLQTLARYYFGSHIGVFVPIGKSSEYSLGYASPSDTNLTVMENKLRNISMVFIGTVYPFGMEPDGEYCSYRRIQLNLATELSSAIFQKIYFGIGYDFTYASISLLGRLATVQELQSGFKPGDKITGGLTSAPTASRNKLDWGVAICMPINLMMSWLGKSLGLK
jgi:hypothetical protein